MTTHGARHRRIRARMSVVILAAVLAAAGCDRGQEVKAPAAPAAPPPPSVVVAEVLRRPVPLMRDFVARTEAVPTAEIRARVQGVLESVRFKEGSEVSEGQVLFVLQQEEYQAALRSARAQLAKARADLTRARDVSVVARAEAQLRQAEADLGKARKDVARYRPLVDARALPVQDLDTALSQEEVGAAAVEAARAALDDTRLLQRTQIELAEAAVESAQAAVTQAELNLGYTTIRSPITGIIGKIEVDRGNLVGKGEPTLLTTVSAVDPIFVDFSITDADLLHFSERIRTSTQGQRPARADLELILADGTVFPQKGRGVFVDRAVDPKTGTIGVRAEFPNPQKVLRPGQFGRVRAVVEEVPNAVLVPQLAIQELQGNKAVLVVGAGDKAAARPVTLGDRYQQFYVVTRGLEGGERVIVEGGQKVQPGMQVAPVSRAEEDKPPAPSAAPPGGAAPPAPAPPPPPAGARPGGAR
jgi:membrane fusion protein (multidrug efflux system)